MFGKSLLDLVRATSDPGVHRTLAVDFPACRAVWALDGLDQIRVRDEILRAIWTKELHCCPLDASCHLKTPAKDACSHLKTISL
jgi:hypothetical protein